MKTISVIIPMYNSEAFIRQCIQSVLNQTYEDFEIIVVDDGSKDRGPEICEEMGKEDGRVCLHRREKQGVSSARNYGMDIAAGEYVFFLDSDDVIHPLLFEEIMCQMEKYHADLAFCAYEKVHSQKMDVLLDRISCKDERPRWQSMEGAQTEERFHQKYAEIMAAIGGKMIRLNQIGKLRFDIDLINGEDTLFMYHLASKQVRAVFTLQRWYFYRMHSESVIHSRATIQGERYFECVRKIRDMEYQKGRSDYLLRWEGGTVNKIRQNYIELKHTGSIESCRKLKKIAEAEKKHPFFIKLPLADRLLFITCFYCRFLFHVLRKLFYVKRILDKKITPNRTNAKVGILTFHCSDNFGAMLQTYGLKMYLCKNGIPTDVVRYDPPYMTGRHWLIPYIPGKRKRGLRGMIRVVKDTRRRFRANLEMGEDFAARRKKMRRFREEYLIDKANSRLFFTLQLKLLTYKYYIVGSDQIWNPEITLGMRKAYFGAFGSRKKERVISYAASFGGASLAPEYSEKFSEFIKYVDAVSVREEEAVSYVEKFYQGKVTAVLDPVFFLKKEDWQKVEQLPEKTGYIFVYITEKNDELSGYVQRLSQEKNLSVIEVSPGSMTTGAGFLVDFSAGPSEFLGYIHQADYVVTNSFHAVAFSIIYQKKFLAFAHSNRGARIRNILQVHGLGDRLCSTGACAGIDNAVDWDEVRKRTIENVRTSGGFLINHILE